MTRKDYVMIAATIRELLMDIDRDGNNAILSDHSSHVIAGERMGAHSVALRLADALAADNPRFERETFLKACSLTA
jgi:hypothetical protein